MDLSEEKALVQQAQYDREAFGLLFDRYHPVIFNYALRRMGTVAPAEDVAAETFRKALSSLWRFQWRRLPFSAWLFRIASNEIATYYRKSAKERTFSLEALNEEGYEPVSPVRLREELEDAERELERHQTFLRARASISVLPERYQEVLTLRFFESKKLEEIAMILGKSQGTVKSLLSRGLAKLRLAMQPLDDRRVISNERSDKIISSSVKPRL